MKILRKVGLIALLIAGIGLGFYITRKIYKSKDVKVQRQSTILVEQIKAVSKLVTVEGYFSEVYSHKDYKVYDISPLRKKALIRVKAKVSVGYDLSEMNVESRLDVRQMVLSEFPDPQILSIDHELEYYDIQQGTFNSFTESDYNEIQKNARQMIADKVEESGLFEQSETQARTILNAIDIMAQSMDWQLRIREGIHLKSLN